MVVTESNCSQAASFWPEIQGIHNDYNSYLLRRLLLIENFVIIFLKFLKDSPGSHVFSLPNTQCAMT